MYVTGYASARSKSFRKLGLFHQHVSYATVSVQLDIGPFQDYVFSLSKALSDVKFQRMNSFGRGTCSRLIATMHGIERRLSDYVLFFDAHTSVSGRNKRQLAGVVGIGIGVLALSDVESLKSTGGEIESRQNILVRQMDGKVSMDLVSSKLARREIEDLKTAAFLSGFELVFQDIAQVYQLPASYMAKEGIISVVVDIPMGPITDYGKFALFKHDSLPFLLDGRLVKVWGESNMVAVSANKDKFVEVSSSDLPVPLSQREDLGIFSVLSM